METVKGIKSLTLVCYKPFSFPRFGNRVAALLCGLFPIKSALFYNQEHHLPLFQNNCNCFGFNDIWVKFGERVIKMTRNMPLGVCRTVASHLLIYSPVTLTKGKLRGLTCELRNPFCTFHVFHHVRCRKVERMSNAQMNCSFWKPSYLWFLKSTAAALTGV